MVKERSMVQSRFKDVLAWLCALPGKGYYGSVIRRAFMNGLPGYPFNEDEDAAAESGNRSLPFPVAVPGVLFPWSVAFTRL